VVYLTAFNMLKWFYRSIFISRNGPRMKWFDILLDFFLNIIKRKKKPYLNM